MKPIALALIMATTTAFCHAEADIGGRTDPLNAVATFLTRHPLPPLPAIEGAIAKYNNAQVLKRTRTMGIDDKAVSAALADVPRLYRSIEASVAAPSESVEFNGTRFSELADFITSSAGNRLIHVKARALTVDRALTISKAGVHIDFAGATVTPSDETSTSYCIHIEGAKGVSIANLILERAKGGIYATASERMRISDCRFSDVAENPIRIAGPVRQFYIRGNRFERSGHAAILVDFDTQEGIIEDNHIEGGRGWGNFQAGMLFSDKGWHRLKNPTQGVPRIDERLKPPTKLIIRHNTIIDGMSSGLYFDGAVMNFAMDNMIAGNSKEGLCFDGGSTGNVLYGNTVRNNGKRYNMTDRALEADFVLRYGRMDDGTAIAKLPGVSIDNAAYNVVVANLIQGNSGGGVKMVRSSMLNTIAFNNVIDNNEGSNKTFHFFGIELGGAEADAPTLDLDFMPSFANRIVGNLVLGDHFSGVLLVPGAVRNIVRENMILGARMFSVDSSVEQDNTVMNNFSTVKPLNVKLSVDSSLVMPEKE